MPGPAVLVDAGALIALFNKTDSEHQLFRRFFADYYGEALTTWPVLTEAEHLVAAHRSIDVLRLVRAGRLKPLDISNGIARIIELMEKYADRPIGLADASLVWAAEHAGVHEIVTTDRTDFEFYRMRSGRALRIVPTKD